MGKGGAGPRHKGVEGRGNSIRIRFQYRGRRSETLKLEPSPANLKYAAQLRGEIQRKITLGTFRYAEYFPGSKFAAHEAAPTVTFRELAGKWLASAEIEKSTREGYRKILDRYWYKAIGDVPIVSIPKSKLQEVLGSVTGSRKTRNNVLIPARRVFAAAMDDEIIAKNPAALIDYLRHQGPGPDPFEPDEVKAILEAMGKRYGPQVEAWFGLGFSAGARTSEQIAVQWGDIDARGRIWRVRRAKVRLEEKGTKTGVERDHELAEPAMAYLETMRPHTLLRGAYVFLDPVTGKPYNDDKPPRERYWRPVLKALGIRYREPYQTRATYITMAIMGGSNPTWVARQVGNSPRVLFKHYARWIDSADRSRERSKVDVALGQIWGKPQGDAGGNAGGAAEGNAGTS